VACASFAAAAVSADEQITLEQGGFVCDKKDQVCYDGRGANVKKTEEMFGRYAGESVSKKLGKDDGWGTKKFTLSNAVKCNIENRICKKENGEGERSKKLTDQLFGTAAIEPKTS
jgi:Fels-1 Prophage Protein-like